MAGKKSKPAHKPMHKMPNGHMMTDAQMKKQMGAKPKKRK